jgi:hypothetical protein
LSSSLVRRRRWIRERICKSDDAKAQHQEQIDYLLSSLVKIEATMTSKKEDYDIAIEYEKERVTAYCQTMRMFHESIQMSLQEIKEYKLRVEQMREVHHHFLPFSLPLPSLRAHVVPLPASQT